jgi:FMN phosphatase YigB (HAD superfamily)
MIKALLFDLDDTLLGNDMNTFIPAYMQALTQRLPPGVDAMRFFGEMLNGTRQMLASADPTRTMRDVFWAHFIPALGGEADGWRQFFEEFYRAGFADLHSLTTPRPEARATLAWAISAGYRVVVATSPLFPLSAIRERMRWANLGDLPIEYVTHFENSHFAKPHPEYFAEVLARLGLRPNEALMIGNDWADDIVPSARLGLPHYWIAPAGSQPPAQTSAIPPRPVGTGDLNDFLRWAQTELADYEPPASPPGALPYRLAGNLAYAFGVLTNLSSDIWAYTPDETEWSLTEIACHLRDVEIDVHQPRLQAILTSENPFIAGLDADVWAAERNYRAQSGPEAWRAFVAARQQTMALLAEQPETAWARAARHSLLGPTTLAEIVGWLLDHDRLHLEQLRVTKQKALDSWK